MVDTVASHEEISALVGTDPLSPGPGGELRIFISGPIRAKTKAVEDKNTEMARRACLAILQRGHAPFCPHTMTAGISQYVSTPHLLQTDLVWLRTCHALFLLPGWQHSAGAIMERQFAILLNVPIFEDLTELPAVEKRVLEVYKNANLDRQAGQSLWVWSKVL